MLVRKETHTNGVDLAELNQVIRCAKKISKELSILPDIQQYTSEHLSMLAFNAAVALSKIKDVLSTIDQRDELVTEFFINLGSARLNRVRSVKMFNELYDVLVENIKCLQRLLQTHFSEVEIMQQIIEDIKQLPDICHAQFNADIKSIKDVHQICLGAILAFASQDAISALDLLSAAVFTIESHRAQGNVENKIPLLADNVKAVKLTLASGSVTPSLQAFGGGLFAQAPSIESATASNFTHTNRK